MNLLVFALPEEDTLPDYPGFIKLFTGVGKVNAAYELTKAILTHNPSVVINFGTAGGITLKKGSFVECSLFYQLDIDCRPLGFAQCETPGEFPRCIWCESDSEKGGHTIGSTDTFMTTKKEPMGVDLVDMEAFALAKVCKNEKVNFKCFKFITDECDTDSPSDWKENIQKAKPYFEEVMKKFI